MQHIACMECASSNLGERHRQIVRQSDQHENRYRDYRARLQPGRERYDPYNQNAHHAAQLRDQLEHVVAKRVLRKPQCQQCAWCIRMVLGHTHGA